jgi:hypothetical protein
MRFNDSADFSGSSFKHPASFDSLYVEGDAKFTGATFESSASFLDAEFKGDADFRAAGTGTTFDTVIFRKCKFRANAIFTNRIFNSTTDFTDCVFTLAPRFEGSTIHQATMFPPESGFLDIESWFAPSAYRTVKLAMESARARREEAIFYSLEQRSLRKRKEEMAGFERFASLAYDATTRYGQSLSRPLSWLFRSRNHIRVGVRLEPKSGVRTMPWNSFVVYL